jgi:hypothetical protein
MTSADDDGTVIADASGTEPFTCCDDATQTCCSVGTGADAVGTCCDDATETCTPGVGCSTI